jgi:hypothetical protein
MQEIVKDWWKNKLRIDARNSLALVKVITKNLGKKKPRTAERNSYELM